MAGGPGNVSGVSYQTDYAVLLGLQLIAQELALPLGGAAISIEPRAHGLEGFTEWDISLDPEPRRIEAKAHLRKQDIVEWVQRVASHAPDAAFELVYGEGGGDYLHGLVALVRLAREARDSAGFVSLTVHAGTVEKDLLRLLGSSAHALLLRCSLRHQPHPTIREEALIIAGLLAGSVDGPRIISTLVERFLRAGNTRRRALVREIIDDLNASGYRLSPPPTIDIAGLSDPLGGALHSLQLVAPSPLPVAIVAAGVGMAEDVLLRECKPYLERGLLTVTDGAIRIAPLPSPLTADRYRSYAPKILDALASHIVANGYATHTRRLVRHCVPLARASVGRDDRLLATLFRRLDKIVKRSGDRHLVYELAQLSITASRQPPRDLEMVQGEAQALICGRSWVYQRVGRLFEARAAAEKSLALGEDIGWGRNTAFCQKCIGRLLRLEAEQASGSERITKLQQSVESLQRAVASFAALPEFGPEHPDIGDCYSLLARTYLVAGQLDDADAAIARAIDLVQRSGSKDYLDLLLVEGDVALARGNVPRARQSYAEALQFTDGDDPEVTELRARAYFAAGRGADLDGDVAEAARSFATAARIYEDLKERRRAAEARWHAARCGHTIPRESVDLLREEPDFRLRMIALDLHQRRLADAGIRTRAGQRGGATRIYWNQLIQEARAQLAREDVGW